MITTYLSSQANLSCEKTIHTFGTDGVLFTRTNFVTLKYKTDSWGTDAHGFKLIITAFKVWRLMVAFAKLSSLPQVALNFVKIATLFDYAPKGRWARDVTKLEMKPCATFLSY